MPDDSPTDEYVPFPFRQGSPPPSPPVLHLTIAWFLNEPHRTGQTARIDRRSWLGRGTSSEDGVPAVAFHTARPERSTPAAPLESTALSRRQLEFTPETGGAVRVRCVGKRKLFHNGIAVEECSVRAGDTLMLETLAVFVVEARPTELPTLRHYDDAQSFPFGTPDADGLVGESPAAWALRDSLAAAGLADDHVLVLGESGAGKELAAAIIHRLSKRAGAFVARSAATFPPGVVDAELFGAAKNYPNAGSPEREGVIGAANGGTLLLDEIGELPVEQQARLLRVMDRGAEYHRLGEARPRNSDFRLIAATNRSPETLKPDFLARFGVRVSVPPLTERRADVPLLARELLRRFAERTPDLRARFFDGPTPRMDPELVDVLVRREGEVAEAPGANRSEADRSIPRINDYIDGRILE